MNERKERAHRSPMSDVSEGERTCEVSRTASVGRDQMEWESSGSDLPKYMCMITRRECGMHRWGGGRTLDKDEDKQIHHRLFNQREQLCTGVTYRIRVAELSCGTVPHAKLVVIMLTCSGVVSRLNIMCFFITS
uniref:Uncharacterized protein n=1 Tax=Anopheles minimus TaxID=112268 RepID=A0A182WPQ7_9DIPT